jgi:hypothetical protein
MPDLRPVDHDPFAGPVLNPVDHDPWASPMTGAQQWESAISANAQRSARAPSTGQQILDIVGGTGQALAAPLLAGPKLMADVASGAVDPNSPEAIRRSTDVALNTAGMGMLGAERGAVGALGGRGGGGINEATPRYSEYPVQNVQKHLTERGFEIPDESGSGPSGTMAAYTGSSYITGYKTDPATGLRTQVNVRIADHDPGKNFNLRTDHFYDVRRPDAEANLSRHLDAVEQSFGDSISRRQQAEQLFDKIGYTATGGDRQKIIQDIDRALKEGRPTARMRAVMGETVVQKENADEVNAALRQVVPLRTIPVDHDPFVLPVDDPRITRFPTRLRSFRYFQDRKRRRRAGLWAWAVFCGRRKRCAIVSR